MYGAALDENVLSTLPHLKPGSTVINSASVTAYQGHPALLDYASTKGAIVSFTRSLALHLAGKMIRVNAVAPARYGHRSFRPVSKK